MSDNVTYTGGCFCGAVQIKAEGDPFLMGYCHCDSCRHWAAAPVNAFTLWSPEAVTYTKGAGNVLTYNKTPDTFRKSCATCGGHLMSVHPAKGFTDVLAAIIPGLPFNPSIHVFYEESVLQIKDGLPKFKDLPEEGGGSGELMPE